MKNVIAAFDLDGTLTTRDTFIDFLFQTFGYFKSAVGIFSNGPILLRYLLKGASNHTAKESVFAYHFKGWPVEEFDGRCRTYARGRLPFLLRRDALSRCDWHRAQGHELVCVTASIRNWVAPWALDHGFGQVIATEVAADGRALTGRFEGKNCYGPEKVRRFLDLFPERDQYTLFAYGDSRGDEELLSFADYPFFRRFH
jgi:phosphatidylglycerophosphatase C